MKAIAALVIVLGLTILSARGTSAAQHAVCDEDTPLPPGTYQDVTAEWGCRLNATHYLRGTLVLHADGWGRAPEVDGTRIDGDVWLYGDADVQGARIGGSVFFSGGYSGSIKDSRIGENVSNMPGFGGLHVVGNRVGGDILLDGAGSDAVETSGNIVAGNLFVNEIGGNFNLDGNRVSGHFRLTDAIAYNLAPSTVNDNRVGGHFEIARAEVYIFPENPPGMGPTIVASGNVLRQHSVVIETVGLEFSNNRVGGTLLCDRNRDFTSHDNRARSFLGQCDFD